MTLAWPEPELLFSEEANNRMGISQGRGTVTGSGVGAVLGAGAAQLY